MTIDEKKEILNDIEMRLGLNYFTMSRYLNSVSTLIVEHISKEEIALMEKQLKNKDGDSKVWKVLMELYNGFIGIGVGMDKVHLPNYFNRSSLLMVFAMLEDTSRELAKAARTLSGAKLKFKEVNGNNDVVKANLYLKKVTNINFDEVNEEWNKITKYTKIRNFIIHHNSRLSSDNERANERFIEYINGETRLKLEDNILSIVDKSYIESFLEDSLKYLYHISAELEEKFINNKG